jgi:hypothetical protein
MVSLKPDADRIRDFLENLAQEDWVKRTERRWWPQFLFHYTDIRNAVRVLQDGCLYSRKYLEDHEQFIVSSGSPDVLSITEENVKDCVRLYFRPQTPTQYYVEGIRSRASLAVSRFPDAHCPVPVFFLFNASHILARVDSRFSDGNLGSGRAKLFGTAAEFENLPWKYVYHTGSIDVSQRDTIVFHRHAEVIVPQKLDLGALRFIYCRSEAERETLLYLLSPDLLKRYQDKIVASTRSTLFYRQHTFVERARHSSQTIDFYFSPETKSPGPFSLLIDLEIASQHHISKLEDFVIGKPYVYRIKLPVSATSYRVYLTLDEHLAYANEYEAQDVPF